jgi:hypothetical protein
MLMKKVTIGNKEVEIRGELFTILACGCAKVFEDEFPRPAANESIYCTRHNCRTYVVRNEVRSNAKG